METLLWLQPLFANLALLSGVLLGFGLILVLTDVMLRESIGPIVQILIRLKFWVMGVLTVFVVSVPLASVDTTYKNILLYRGINSENASEIMDSSTRILKLAEKYVEGKVKDGRVQED